MLCVVLIVLTAPTTERIWFATQIVVAGLIGFSTAIAVAEIAYGLWIQHKIKASALLGLMGLWLVYGFLQFADKPFSISLIATISILTFLITWFIMITFALAKVGEKATEIATKFISRGGCVS